MSEEKKAITNEEILGFLGLSDVNSVDELKEKFTSEFFRKTAVPDEIKSSITGQAFRNVGKNIREVSKNYGVELTNTEIETKKIEDIFTHVIDSVKNNYETKLSDLSKQINEPNEALKDWEKKYQKLESKYKETESLLNNTASEFNGFKEQASSQLKSFKINVGKKDLFSKIPFSSDVDELKLKGFDSYISENFNLDIEDDELVITNKKGEKIINEKVVGTFKKPEDVLKEKAIEFNLIATNQHAKNNVQAPQQITTRPAEHTGIKTPFKPFGI